MGIHFPMSSSLTGGKLKSFDLHSKGYLAMRNCTVHNVVLIAELYNAVV